MRVAELLDRFENVKRVAPVPFVDDADFTLYNGDVLDVLAGLPDESVNCCVTSPPYWGLRDYGVDGQLGLEATPEKYVARMVEVFREVRRVLRSDGTCWLNLGDSYAGSRAGEQGATGQMAGRSVAAARCRVRVGGASDEIVRGKRNAKRWGGGNLPCGDGLKPKDLIGIPWRVALALQEDSWYLRSDIVWSKSNPMPESVTDRPTKSHEYVFLLTKSARYFYDAAAIAEPATWYGPNGRPKSGPHAGQMQTRARRPADNRSDDLTRNARSVWTIQTQQFADAHFAVFPEELPRRCIAAGCPKDGVVLDPFMGSGTTALVARKLGRRSIGIELSPEYSRLISRRLQQQSLFAEESA